MRGKLRKRDKYLTSSKTCLTGTFNIFTKRTKKTMDEEITLKFNNDYEYYDAIYEICYVITKVDDPTVAFEEVERILTQFKEEK
jgi:hypothetical protein